MRTREHWDTTWCPYCIRCSTFERMKDLGVEKNEEGVLIQKFKCNHCPGKHERIYPVNEPRWLWTEKPLKE